MYCEFCGKKIDLDAKYCEHCGKQIKTAKIYSFKKNQNETKILITIVLIALFSFLFYQELKYFNSPENAINHYLRNLKNQNLESILNTFNMETNEFTSTSFLKRKSETNENLKSYNILECNYENDKKSAICSVNYTTTKNGISKTKTYRLKKKEEKRFLLFTNWIIENQDIELLEEWTLYLPTSSKGKLEGIDLEKYRDNAKTKDGYDAYTIHPIIKGEYNLTLTTDNGISLNTTININTKEYTYQFTIKDISKEMETQILTIGKELINTFYQGIINHQKREEIKSSYEISEILTEYENLKKEIEKNITLKKFDVTEIKINNLKMDTEGKIIVTFQMNYSYQFEYFIDKEKKTHEGNSNDIFYLTFKNTELKEIEKIDSLVSYFSKRY